MSNTYTLNNTPIRTSISYKINDITFKDLDLPSQQKSFNCVEVQSENVDVRTTFPFEKLTFGMGAVMEDNMAEYCNSAYAIQPTSSQANFAVTYTFDDNNRELSNYIFIEADKDMSVTIAYRSQTELACYHQFILKTKIKNKAKVHVEIINLLNEKTNHFISVENTVEEDSQLEMILIDLGGKNSVSNLYSNMIGDGSMLNTESVYIGQNDVLKDMNYIAHLRGKKSVAEMELQGVLSDRSKKNLKFTVDFKTGCTGAIGRELESCLLLSDDARYLSLPILLCSEDNVEGAHSAAAGQVDPEQLFYIMSRGFTKKEATKMLVRAKYNQIIEKLQDSSLRNEIIAEIDRRL